MKRHVLALALLVPMLISTLAGCTKKATDPVASAFVLGARSNSFKIDYNCLSIYQNLYDSCYSWGSVSAVIVDGSPEKINKDYRFEKPIKVSNGSAKHVQIVNEATSFLIRELSSLSAKNPEADTLGAISTASRALKNQHGVVKRLVICDSGLSTVSPLAFNESAIINVSPEDVVSELKRVNAIPDLSFISEVIWVGLGQINGEQQPLTADYLTKLEAIWRAILTAGGAKNIEILTTATATEKDDSMLPHVSSIAIPESTINLGAESLSLPDVQKLDENSIGFFPDSLTMVDKQDAINVLRPTANILNQSSSLKVLIVGSTATVSNFESARKFSLNRAEIIKDILCNDLGVDQSKVACVGWGCDSSTLRTPDTDSNGKLTNAAQENRCSYILDASGETAKQFI